jgi:hypothetical protein
MKELAEKAEGCAVLANGPAEISLLGEKLDQIIALLERDRVDEQEEGKNTWLNTEQAARHVGLSERAVRVGAQRGSIPGHKYPRGSKRGRWMFRRAELDDLILKGRTKRRSRGA